MKKRDFFIFLFLLIIIFLLIFLIFPFREIKEGKKTEKFIGKLQGGLINLEKEKEKSKEESKEESNVSLPFFPTRKKELKPLLLEKAALAALFYSEKSPPYILYEKETHQKLSFASLTKLMTAMIVLDWYPLEKEVEISREAVLTEGESGRLSLGEKISIRGLLELSLLVSSNDASTALAEIIGERKFIDLMNKKAKEIGLKNTYFLNPHGLDQEGHYSSAYDLALMTYYSLYHYPLIWEILSLKEKNIISKDYLGREINHYARNTNKLLGIDYVLGGKTGYTGKALDTMILAIEAPGKVKGYVVLVLLGVDKRIERTKQLYEWLFQAWQWE